MVTEGRKSRLTLILIASFVVGFIVSYLVFMPSGMVGSDVELINDRDYAPAMIAELQQADTSIHIAMFSITYYDDYPDSSVNKMLEELVYAKNRGLDVRIVVDEYPEDHEKGIEFLEKYGVPVRHDGPEQSTHAKLIIIDGKTTILGSTNWRYYSVDKNHEADVIIRNQAVALEYEQYFEEIWENAS